MGSGDGQGGAAVTPDLVRRQKALSKTMAKYRGVPFEWGKADCVKMLRSHLVAMGHKKLPKQPDYSTAVGAKQALKEMGFDSVAALLDSLLPKIAGAYALPGDIVLMGGLYGLDTVAISTGGGKVAGWHQDGTGVVVVDPEEIKGVWRA